MTIAPVKERKTSRTGKTISVQEKRLHSKGGDTLFSFRTTSAVVDFCSSLPPPLAKAALVTVSLIRFFGSYMGKDRHKNFLSVKFLRTIVGRDHATPALNALKSSGLLECNDHFIKGKQSRAYSLSPLLRNSTWFVSTVSTFAPLASLTFDPWERFVTYVKSNPKNAHLLEEEKRLLDAQARAVSKLSVKKSAAFKSKVKSEALRLFKAAKKRCANDRCKVKRYNKKAAQKGLQLKLMPVFSATPEYFEEIVTERINSIDQKNWQASVHSRTFKKGTGRIFTNVTNCPKAFRPFLRIDGEKTVNVDIRCAQPSLLALFYDPATQEDKEEREKFVENITDKDFYSEMAANSPEHLTRDVLKVKTFSFIFGRNEHQDTKIGRTFQATYPVLHKRMTELKEKEGYKECAYRMQCAEVDAVIYGAFKELDSKGIVAITIHDSITCKESDAAKVQEALERHFEKKMGFKPFVRTDRYEDVD